MGDDSSFHLSAVVQIFCHNPFAILYQFIYTWSYLGPQETDDSFATDFPVIMV